MLNISCTHCGKMFHKKPSHIHVHNYCSTKCMGEASRTLNWAVCPVCQHRGIRAIAICGSCREYSRPPRIKKACIECGNPCHSKNAVCKRCQGKDKPESRGYVCGCGAPKDFTSQHCVTCYDKANSRTHWTPEEIEFLNEHYSINGAAWCAEQLGKDHIATRDKANRLKITLNKNAAYRIVHSKAQEYMSSPNNPNWRDGGAAYEFGNNWLTQRKAARIRDNCFCQICFIHSVEVHHIIPRRYFKGHMEDANVLSNLIVLCPPHHKMVEWGTIPCPKPQTG